MLNNKCTWQYYLSSEYGFSYISQNTSVLIAMNTRLVYNLDSEFPKNTLKFMYFLFYVLFFAFASFICEHAFT